MGSKGGNTTTSQFKPPAEFMKAYKEALGMARTATSQPYQQYSGNLVAGLTPSQQQGIANVNAAQGMALPAIQQGMQYTQQAAQGITPELYNRFYSPYVKDVADTTFANLMESQAQQQSGLKSGAIQAGAFGGDRSGIAQAEMARQQQLANAMSMSNIYNQGYGQAMGLAGQQVANMGAMGQQLAGLGAGAQASVLQGAQAQMAAGAQEQATEQARLQAAYDQWMQRQAYPYQQAQFFANIAQGLGAGAGGTSSTTAPAPNVFSQIFGGLGAVGSIFSDERMKENIKAVGKLNDGQTIYRYNFKGDPKTQIGLLAQEVESHKPGAVTQVKGLKMVDYADATEDAASMGGVVGPSQYRQGLAEGGIPYHPYGDARAYVPEGKIAARGANIPPEPTAFKDEGLAKDWQDIMPLSEDQVTGLRKFASDIGIDLPERKSISDIFRRQSAGPTDAEAAWINKTNPDASLTSFSLASGGVVGRHRYADGGSMMDQAIDEAEGLGAAPEYAPPAGLIRAESGGNFGARNAQGYVGRLQFGEARLTDAKRAGVIPAEMTAEEFRLSPEAQKATEAWHFSDINNFIDKTGLAGVEGKAIKGVPVTREGMVNVAHLGGKGGLEKFVASGGRYDPADANGTRLSDYLALGAKSGGVSDAGPIPSPAASDGLGGVQEDPPEFVVSGEKSPTGLKLAASKIFADEDNPSIIERIMGRRLSPEARAAVMNASFAMMAGRSPNFITNLGEAGVVGSQTYYNALQQKRAQEKQDAEFALKERERQKQEAREKMIEEAISQLPPEQQFAARLAPEKFFGAQAESIFGSSDLPALVEEYYAAKKEGFKGTLEDWKKLGVSNSSKLGLQPVPLVDAENNFIGFGQMSPSGGLYYNGKPIDNVNVRPMNPADLNKIKEIGKGEGRSIGEARGDIAGAEKQASITIEKISELEDNPNLDAAVGWTSYLPDFAVSSEVIDVRGKVDELMGGAFLEARTILKGGGQITDFESARAERAYSRMERAIQASNPKVFRDALMDFREAVLDGVEKLRATAQLPPTGSDEIPDVTQMTDEQLEEISKGNSDGQ